VVVDVEFKQRVTMEGAAFSVMLLKVRAFWDVVLCRKAGRSPCSEGESCVHLQLDPEGEDAIILLRHWELSAEVQCHISEDTIR